MQHYLDTRNAPPITRLLARFIVNTRYEDLSPATVKAAELALYDWVGCAMVSGQTDKAAKMAQVAAQENAQGGALVWVAVLKVLIALIQAAPPHNSAT